jgi:hypothetical protein
MRDPRHQQTAQALNMAQETSFDVRLIHSAAFRLLGITGCSSRRSSHREAYQGIQDLEHKQSASRYTLCRLRCCAVHWSAARAGSWESRAAPAPMPGEVGPTDRRRAATPCRLRHVQPQQVPIMLSSQSRRIKQRTGTACGLRDAVLGGADNDPITPVLVARLPAPIRWRCGHWRPTRPLQG